MPAVAKVPVWEIPRNIAAEDDRAWFREHPLRTCRVRRPRADECPDHLNGRWVVVRRVASNVRLRFVVVLGWPPGDDDEEAARELFEEVARRKEARNFIDAIEREFGP